MAHPNPNREPRAANTKAIDSIVAEDVQFDVGLIDRPGLAVRTWPSGKKVFVHRFKCRGQTFKITLGEYPRIKLETLLKLHADQRDQLRKGENPAATAQLESHARANAPTVYGLAQRYLEEHARPRKRSAYKDEAILERDVLPKWGKLEARAITYLDVDGLINKIKSDKKRGYTAPRHALAIIRKMFAFAVQKRILPQNPAKGIDIGKPPVARMRALNDSELRALIVSLPALSMHESAKDALRLQLYTGTRIGEPLGASCSEFDLDAREWLIPGERTKNGLPLVVPLSRPALEIVKRRVRESVDGGLLFLGGKAAMSLQTGSVSHALKRELPNIKDADGKAIAPFTSHDLRRTVETGLARLGVSREIRDRVLNHKDASVGAVHYNRHDFLQEKRAALDAWARKLEQIVSGKESTVTPLRRMENRSRRG